MRGNWIASTHLATLFFTGKFHIPQKLLFLCVKNLSTYFCCFVQYIPFMMKGGKNVFDRFAVLFSVIIVWIYAHLLTVGGAYKNTPLKTQLSCRTDRAGIIGASPW